MPGDGPTEDWKLSKARGTDTPRPRLKSKIPYVSLSVKLCWTQVPSSAPEPPSKVPTFWMVTEALDIAQVAKLAGLSPDAAKSSSSCCSGADAVKVTRSLVKVSAPMFPDPMREMMKEIVSAWAVRGRMRAEARSGSAKRALRMEGFPSRIGVR